MTAVRGESEEAYARWLGFLADLAAEAERIGLPAAEVCSCLYGPLRGRHSLDGSHPALDLWASRHPFVVAAVLT